MTPGRDRVLSPALNEMKEQAVATGALHEQPAARVLPVFEPMGAWPTRQREFWWEREWRHVGKVYLLSRLKGMLVLCPEDEIDEFQALTGRTYRICIDPRWGSSKLSRTSLMCLRTRSRRLRRVTLRTMLPSLAPRRPSRRGDDE
jgi:hypothetical protein